MTALTPVTPACRVEDIDPEGGVPVLHAGRAVALFRTFTDELFALDNIDPFSNASVLARGLVGTLERPGGRIDFVASPMHKQRFDLRTGACLEDGSIAVATYEVSVSDGLVTIGARREPVQETA